MLLSLWLRKKHLLIPLFVFILVYWAYFLRLADSIYPSGWDAYFYLIQVKAIVEEGEMHSPDYSPVYLLLKWIYYLCGNYELAFQHLCAGLGALFACFASTLSFRISKNSLLSLCIGIWCFASPSLAFFAANFPKNLLGIDFLLLLFVTTLGKNPISGSIAFFLTAIGHRMTAGLGLLFIGFRFISLRNLLLIVLVGGILFTLSLVIPGLLHFSDLQRFGSSFSAIPQLPHLSFTNLLSLIETQPVWVVEILISLLLWIWTVFSLVVRPLNLGEHYRWYRGIFLLSLILFFPFLTIDVTSMGYRFFLTGILLTPVFLLGFLHHNGLPKRILGFGLLLVLAAWGLRTIDTQQFDPDYSRYATISERVALNFAREKPELIIAHKGLAEVITFKTGIDALPWLPEYEIAPDRLYRIASEVSDFEIEAVLKRSLGPKTMKLGIFYLLLPESDWQEFVDRVESRGTDEELLERIHQWQNPMEIRPAFLLRNKAN